MQECPRQRHALPHALGILADRTGQRGIEVHTPDCVFAAPVVTDSV